MDVDSGIKLHRIPSHAVLHERTQTGGQNAETLFYDTGFAVISGIRTVEALVAHPKFGDIFENLIIAETMKQHLNANQEPQLFFYRDASKVEVDLLEFTDPQQPYAHRNQIRTNLS